MNTINLQALLLPIIIYVITTLSLYFILKAMKYEIPWFAFIPFYGEYVVYKEYSKLIFKRKWHIIYLIGLSVQVVIALIISFYISTTLNNSFVESMTLPISVLIEKSEILFALYSIDLLITLVMKIILFYPILYKDKYKIMFILLIVFAQSMKIINQVLLRNDEMNIVNKNFYTVTMIQNSISYLDIIIALIALIAAAKVHNKVVNKRVELRTVVEKGNFSLVK